MFQKSGDDYKKLTRTVPVLLAALVGCSIWLEARGSAGGEAASQTEAAAVKPILLPRHEQVDWEAFPSGYMALGDRLLMSPVTLGNWPHKINSSHQLFVDDFLIAEFTGLVREFHRPLKYPGNPVLRAEHSWEKLSTICAVKHVLRDKATGKFRMWYCLLRYSDEVRNRIRPQPFHNRFPLCYAESDDGIHWTRPALGIYEIEGSKDNNVIFWNTPMWMIRDPHEKDPQHRWKAYLRNRPPGFPVEGLYLYTSPDGLRWKPAGASDRPVIPARYEKHFSGYVPPHGIYPDPVHSSATRRYPRHGVENVWVHYDPVLGKFIANLKFSRYAGKICVGMMESDDLIHWSPPRVTLYPDHVDEPDTEYYNWATFPYESMWMGLLRVKHTKPAGHKQTDIQLVASRDGRTWYHAGNRELLLPLGKKGSWESDYTGFGPIVEVGDELWFYYMGSRRGSKGRYDQRAIGLAKMRRDGFISLNAGNKPGTLLTRPLAFDGRKLFVNAEVSEGGYVKVAVCDDLHAKPLGNYALGECVAATANTMRGRITWRQTKELPTATGSAIEKHVRLRFELKNAKLYSFWIE